MNLQNNTKTRISMHHIEDRNSFSNLVSEWLYISLLI
jgi:hypothetical protein